MKSRRPVNSDVRQHRQPSMLRTTHMQMITSILLKLVCMLIVAGQTIDDTRKFDEFYGSSWQDAMAHLDSLALSLRNNPNAIGVLIVYGGQRSARGEKQKWSGCIRRYLVNRRGIDPKRIVVTNGGYRERLTVELWETAN